MTKVMESMCTFICADIRKNTLHIV